MLAVICLLTEKISVTLKPIKNVNFPTHFFLGNISNGLGAAESREVSVNENVYDFLVHYNAIDMPHILNICIYLMVKNNLK